MQTDICVMLLFPFFLILKVIVMHQLFIEFNRVISLYYSILDLFFKNVKPIQHIVAWCSRHVILRQNMLVDKSSPFFAGLHVALFCRYYLPLCKIYMSPGEILNTTGTKNAFWHAIFLNNAQHRWHRKLLTLAVLRLNFNLIISKVEVTLLYKKCLFLF